MTGKELTERVFQERNEFDAERQGLRLELIRVATDRDALELGLWSMADAAEMLWVVIANVSGGDWTKQSPEWQEAVARWGEKYFAALDRYVRLTSGRRP